MRLRLHALLPLAALALASAAAQTQELRVVPRDMNPAPGLVLRSHLTRIASGQLARRSAQLAEIRTKQQFEERRSRMKQAFIRMIGGLPEQKTPLKTRVTGTLQRDGYEVRKLIYESQPSVFVTANLYVPKTGKAPYPAVLQPLGHSPTAKARSIYQSLSIGLVKNGFIVLTYDPAGQGERKMYFDPDLGDSKAGGPTAEHEMAGMQALLGGESIARHMIWDGIRGIDLLSELPEVDPKRIGVSGCSGGGTMTVYIAAADDRVAAVAPACYVTSWDEQLKDTGPQDAEQEFPNQLLEGFNHGDLITMTAPKPYLICSTTEDFFPLEGARNTYEESKRIYGLFGAEDRIGWFYTGGTHGMPKPTREAIYSWMSRWLRGSNAPAKEPNFQIEYEEDLNCTRTGQVSTDLGGETPSTLNRKRFATIRKNRSGSVPEMVVKLTSYERQGGEVQSRSTGTLTRDGYRIEKLIYSTASDRYVPALLFTPNSSAAGNRTVLFLDSAGKSAEARPDKDLEQLARMGYTVLAIDPSGVGETNSAWGEDRISWLGMMVGKPLVGIRMEDIARGIDLLEKRGLLAGGGLIGYAKGLAGVDLLHAAAVDTRIREVCVDGMLASYRLLAAAPMHRSIHGIVIPGVLHAYDLPDLAKSIAPRQVNLINLKDAMGMPLRLAVAKAEYTGAGNVSVGLRHETGPVTEVLQPAP